MVGKQRLGGPDRRETILVDTSFLGGRRAEEGGAEDKDEGSTNVHGFGLPWGCPVYHSIASVQVVEDKLVGNLRIRLNLECNRN